MKLGKNAQNSDPSEGWQLEKKQANNIHYELSKFVTSTTERINIPSHNVSDSE